MIYTLVRKDTDNNIDAIISFDSVKSMDENWSATVTEQVVESGFNISDNINIESPSFTIDAVLSSYTLFDTEKEIVWDGESFSTTKNTEKNNHIIAREALIKVFSDRSILTLVESSNNSSSLSLSTRYEELQSGYHKEIENCVITSLSISHPDSGSGAFLVSLKVQEIKVALVLTAELVGSEAIPTVRPYVGKEGYENSTTKSESDVEDGDVAATNEESEATSVEKEKPSSGNDWYTVYNQKQKELIPQQQYKKALNDMENHMAKTGDYCRIIQVSGGWDKLCTKTR